MITYQDEIVLIDKKEILAVVRCALSKVDPRLVDHGQRVSYIASKIYEQCPDRDDLDFSKLFVLCLLHDIGAYKTNEIDDMVRFETESYFDHSLYGYLFLKTPHSFRNVRRQYFTTTPIIRRKNFAKVNMHITPS